MTRSPAAPAEWRAAAVVIVLGVLLFAVRLAGPADLTDNDQEGPTAYVLDVLQNGHWLVQRDAHGEIASKPPLYTWMAALTALAGGGLSRFTLYLPCAAAVILTAWLVLRGAARQFGIGAGLVGAFSMLFSQFGIKHVVLARTDALFMVTVTLAALAAWRAWRSGRGWTTFWLLAAAASLTKGPLGLMFASGGLLAILWERWGARRVARSRGKPSMSPATAGGGECVAAGQGEFSAGASWRAVLPGLALYLVVVGGWFALAYAQVGTDLTDKQVNRELVGHLSGASAGGHWPGSKPLHPFAYFLARYAPWSLLTCLGLWQVWRRPAVEGERRRFRRFLACWFLGGLVILAIAPHKRADLLLPLLPAAAMLGASAVATRLEGRSPAIIGRWALGLGLVAIAIIPIVSRCKVEAAEVTSQTQAMERMATWIRQQVPPEAPLTFAGNCMTLQFYLGRHQFHTSPENAAMLLQSAAPCLVVTTDGETIERSLPAGVVLHELAREPAAGPPRVRLLSNRPQLALWAAAGVGVGPVTIQLAGATFRKAEWLEFHLEPRSTDAAASLSQAGSKPTSVGVAWSHGPVKELQRRMLQPGESWRTQPGAEPARSGRP